MPTSSPKQSAPAKQQAGSSQSTRDAWAPSQEAGRGSAVPLYSRDQSVLPLTPEAATGQSGASSESETEAGRADGAAPVASSAGEGQPLEAGLRHPMERFFQRPLDKVRVHSGPESRRAADSHGAYALTYGQDIHLGARGESLPRGQMRGLLAHETAHTIQQGHAQPVTQLSAVAPEGEGSPAEQQASGLSRAFMAHEGGDSAGLAIRDSIGLRPLSSPRVQLARHPTHFGEFEDVEYNELTAGAGSSVPTGTKLGVQLYLKFHPGNNVDAKKIGLTQAADTVIAGTRPSDGLIARRSATRGPGRGYHIDVPEDRPSPMYAASGTPTAGTDATKLGSYTAPGVGAGQAGPMSIGGNNVIGITHGGGSVYGYRYMDAGTLKGPVPAEFHDAPQDPTASNDSQQMFETAALAMEGAMEGTYLGSVQWGWRRDASGAFKSTPVSVKSMGVPSANFLTAATIWNASKENIEYVATAQQVDVLDPNNASNIITTVPRGTRMRFEASGLLNGTTFLLVRNIDPAPAFHGIVDVSDVRQQDSGRETVDLPVPQIYTVSAAGGSVLSGERICTPNDPTLPPGTRVRVLGPYGNLPEYVRVEIVDGPLTGRRGVLRRSDLTSEPLGQR